MSPKTLTLDLVITHLLNKEVQQITATPLVKEDDQIKMELDEAMAVSCAKAILEVLVKISMVGFDKYSTSVIV